MTQALEELRIAYNWACSGNIKQAQEFTYSALMRLIKLNPNPVKS